MCRLLIMVLLLATSCENPGEEPLAQFAVLSNTQPGSFVTDSILETLRRHNLEFFQLDEHMVTRGVSVGPVLLMMAGPEATPAEVRVWMNSYAAVPEIRWRFLARPEPIWTNNSRLGPTGGNEEWVQLMDEFQFHAYFSGGSYAYERHFIPGFQAGWVEQPDGTWLQGRSAIVTGGAGVESDVIDPGETLVYKYDAEDSPMNSRHFIVVTVFEDRVVACVADPDGIEKGDRMRMRLTKPRPPS